MKLLSLRLCDHDSNISYWDGKLLHYFKSERKYQEKYHRYTSFKSKDLYSWIDDVIDLWDITPYEMDDIVIIFDEWTYTPVEEYDKNISFLSKPVQIQHPILHGVNRLNHHYAHALSSQFLYGRSDIDFVIDGEGDDNNIWSVFKKETPIQIRQGSKEDSVGWRMNHMGTYFGINCNFNRKDTLDYAGKLMGLQSYGNIDQDYHNQLKNYKIEDVNVIFSYENWVDYIGDKTVANLRKLDWSRTIHEVMGDVLVEFFKRYANKNDKITYSGGVAQNVIWNTKLKKEFPNLVIPPYPGDEGLSIGGIEFLRRKHNLPEMNLPNFPFSQSDENTETPSIKTIQNTAKALAENKIVAWYQGNGEIGPRSLGNRSILMNPLIKDGKNKINSVKKREGYRPFGAVVLDEYKQDYFEVNQDFDNPYMLYVANVKDERLKCITHVDKTCRIQTLKNENPVLRSLMEEFYKLTGCPILLNTSLNLAGKPIAAYKENVYELLRTTSIDIGVVGDAVASNPSTQTKIPSWGQVEANLGIRS